MWHQTSFGRLAGRLYALGLLLAVGLLAGCPGPHLMPTPNVYVQAPSNPFADVARPCAPTPWTCSTPRTGSPSPGMMAPWPMALAGRSRWRWVPVWSQ